MRKIALFLALVLTTSIASAQKTAGVILYNFKFDRIKALETATFLSEDERQRNIQVTKNFPVWSIETQLTFNNTGSYYAKSDNEQENTWGRDDYWVRRDFENARVLESQSIDDKPYIIDDELYHYNWKIKTEIKEIAGHLCMLATATDTLRKQPIEVWYTTDIPVSVGPEIFMGLPGAILEVSIGNGIHTITATSVQLKDTVELPPLPKRIRGKRYTKVQYEKLRGAYLKDAEESKHFAWGVRL